MAWLGKSFPKWVRVAELLSRRHFLQAFYLMLIAAQSPIVNTPWPTDLCPDFCLDIPTLPDRLDERGLTWCDYAGLFASIKGLVGRPEITLN